MQKVSHNDFSGGMAQDVRELRTDTYAKAIGWNITDSQVMISTFPSKVVETGSLAAGIATYTFNDAIGVIDTTGESIFAVGTLNNSTALPKFASKNSMTPSDPYLDYTNSGDASGDVGSVVYGSLATYRNKVFAMRQATFLSQGKLVMYDRTTTTYTQVGTIFSTAVNTGEGAKPFVHSQSNIIYTAHGSVVAQYDGTTFTAAAFTVASDLEIMSLSEFGSYLAIGCQPRAIGGRSKVYLWNLDTGNTRAQEILDFGEGFLKVLENVNGELIGLSISSRGSSFGVAKTGQLTMRVYNGGAPVVVGKYTPSQASNFTLYNFKGKKNNIVYFAAQMAIGGVDTHQLFCCGKNQNGRYFLTPDQYLIAPATDTIIAVNGFGIVGDYFFFGFRGTNLGTGMFYRTTDQSNSFDPATLDSLINSKMPVRDRPLKKKLKGIYFTSPTGGVFTVSYSVDGSAFTQVYTGTVSANSTQEITAFDDGSHFKEGKEYQFRIVVTAGSAKVSLSEWGYWYEKLQTQIPQ